jgi:hypothetical protein
MGLLLIGYGAKRREEGTVTTVDENFLEIFLIINPFPVISSHQTYSNCTGLLTFTVSTSFVDLTSTDCLYSKANHQGAA